ncbi:MAG: hypothetical protein HY268_19005 [Deltaproteobacteria bacterium]|nr:hypothetical protein [Deltaproteobacteria bacterium]
MLRAHLADEDREHLVVLLLNSQNRLIGINTMRDPRPVLRSPDSLPPIAIRQLPY